MSEATGCKLFALLLAVALGGLGGGLAGCKGAPEEQAEIREELEETDAGEVAEAAIESDFTPPEDGKLSDRQVEMYLEVREQEKKTLGAAASDLETRPLEPAEGARAQEGTDQPGTDVTVQEVAGSEEEMAEVVTADVRAAQELGHDPLEYQWVKGQVLQAQMALYTDRYAELEESGRQEVIRSLEEMRDLASNELERGAIDRQVEKLRLGEPAPAEQAEGLRHNMRLVREHQRDILALERWPEAVDDASAGGM